jgi:predicted SAM-dependent methyltransferase
VLGHGALREALPALRDIARALFWPQPEPVKRALRSLLDEVRLARVTTAAAPQFTALRGEKGLLLHLGCGNHLKDGWLNLDLNLNGTAPELPPQRLPQTRFILYDLRSGTLPLDDDSCELIYSSHFFEHLAYDDGERLMRDCHRVLQPGGTFRAALPDFPELFRAYLERDEKVFELYSIFDVFPHRPPETVTLVDHVNANVYEWGHKCIYDQEKICRVLRHLGFASVEITDYREGIDPASELRRRYSFYVEATK